MARSLRIYTQHRRTQRWLRREALVLAREAARFDCFDATRQAQRLVDIVEGRAGNLYVAMSA